MEILFGLLVGVLMSASVWLMLSRNLVKFLFGLTLISNVANMIIFAAGGLTFGAPPLIEDGVADPVYANALPQALVLTAIVIGFGLVSFTLVLALRAYQESGTVDVEVMCRAERRDEPAMPAPEPAPADAAPAVADAEAAPVDVAAPPEPIAPPAPNGRRP